MKRLIFDLETDGLLQTFTKIHCAVLVDMDSSYSELFLPETMGKFLEIIDDSNVELIGHNIYNFDLKVIEKLYGWKPNKKQKITDTFLLAQILFPDIEYEDINDSHGASGRIFTAKESGSHSLKAWGQRVGCYKGEYNGGFEKYSDEMGKYCIQDGFTTKSLYKFLESKIDDKILPNAITLKLENDIAPILARQQAYGVMFNRKKAEELYTTLQANLVDLKWELQEVFKPKYISLGEVSPKRTQCRNGQRYIKGGIYTRIKLQEFNPGSRPQIAKRLKEKFGWIPEEFTDKGNVKMDEEIIDNLPYKEMQPLKEYLQTKLLMSKVMTGAKAWIKCVGEDGRIHGGILQNGAITGRMAHFSPNF
ncbi:MAG: DNA polymerase, partial [Nanoarchaeota archaeon]